MTSTLIQDAALRNLQILTESSQHLSELAKGVHSEVDWRAMAGFRNILIHNYLGINLPRVWEVVTQLLPVLKQAVQAMLDESGGASARETN